jgi:UDP:flavonoid glycosyltransferase YjiC (YdhE family)
VFTTGSAGSGQKAFYTAALEACQRLNQPGHFVTQNRDQIPSDLPANIEYSSHIAFDQLFRRAAMVVHHGGIGTSAFALAAGIPQLLCPLGGDQFDNANRLQKLGVGRIIDKQRITPSKMTRAIDSMLNSSSVSRQCERWRTKLANENGVRHAADIFENFCNELPVSPLD